jgi:hypothetical protein
VARRVRLAGLAFDTLSSDVGPAVG